MNHLKNFLMNLVAAALVTSTAMAQTVGIGSTKRGYTSQASAAISKVVSQKTEIQMRVQPYGGSSAYVPLVSGGKLEFGLANEIEAASAVAGKGIYKGRPQPELQVAALLQPFRVAFTLAGFLLLVPPGAFAGAIIIDLLGFMLAVFLVIRETSAARRLRKVPTMV